MYVGARQFYHSTRFTVVPGRPVSRRPAALAGGGTILASVVRRSQETYSTVSYYVYERYSRHTSVLYYRTVLWSLHILNRARTLLTPYGMATLVATAYATYTHSLYAVIHAANAAHGSTERSSTTIARCHCVGVMEQAALPVAMSAVSSVGCALADGALRLPSWSVRRRRRIW